MRRLEFRLVTSDRWWFERGGLGWFAARGPRLVLELLEAAYASAYVMVPLGFAIVFLGSGRVDADRYWAPVVLAELACYAMLPWLRARPPGAIGAHTAINARRVALRRLNRAIQAHGSIRVATIPSGHAAGALATAFAVSAVMPAAFGPLLLWALVIALGSVVGRYHYAVDALLGLAVGAIAGSGVGVFFRN
jgi:membrane-associated phospholipid phosphatase